MRINNNLMAMNTHRQLGLGNTAGAKSMEKLSSGFRINRAGDDAAGLAISEKMRGQIRGLNQASRNGQDAISLVQTAEGALNETQAILQRMRELAVQSATDTNVDVDREALQEEVNQLATEITRIADNTEFNTQNLLDGSFTGKIFHIGANENQDMNLSIGAMDATTLGVASAATSASAVASDGTTAVTLASVTIDASTVPGNYTVVDLSGNALYSSVATFGLADKQGNVVAIGTDGTDPAAAALADIDEWLDVNDTSTVLLAHTAGPVGLDAGTTITITGAGGIDISSQATASSAITVIDDALKDVSEERAKLGAVQNRLEHTIKNLDTSSENLQASESRIRDVDMAKEMMEFTKNNILQQAAQAMLAQAQQIPQGVLQLLR